MSNCYTQFTGIFVPHSTEQADYIRSAFKAAASGDEEDLYAWAEKTGAGELDEHFLSGIDLTEAAPDEGQAQPTFAFSSDESGVIDHIAELISAAQTKFDDPRAWALETAFTSDKRDEDGFGGSAVVVRDGMCTYFSTSQWIREQLAGASEVSNYQPESTEKEVP